MEHTGGFLDKYVNLTPPHGVTRQAVADVINKHLGTDLPVSVIRVHNETVWLDVSPATKNTVAIHKKDLLAQLRERLGKTHAPRDIR